MEKRALPLEMRSCRTRLLTLSPQESSITFLLSQARRSLSSECLLLIASGHSRASSTEIAAIPIVDDRVALRCIHREAIDRDAAR